MAEGNADQAQNYLSKATSAKNYSELLGTIQIAQGNYAQAAQSLNGVKTNAAALAQILNKDYSTAAATLNGVAKPNALTSYLKAVVAARTQQSAAVVSNLKDAIAKDSKMKARAAKDLEFAAYFNDANFQSVVK